MLVDNNVVLPNCAWLQAPVAGTIMQPVGEAPVPSARARRGWGVTGVVPIGDLRTVIMAVIGGRATAGPTADM